VSYLLSAAATTGALLTRKPNSELLEPAWLSEGMWASPLETRGGQSPVNHVFVLRSFRARQRNMF